MKKLLFGIGLFVVLLCSINVLFAQQKAGKKPHYKSIVNRISNGFALIVSGTTVAGPEKINYQLREAVSQGPNPKILLLEVYDKPTMGNIQKRVVPFFKTFKGTLPYESVQIIERDSSILLPPLVVTKPKK